MAKLIKLTHLRGEAFYLNADKIVEVRGRFRTTEEATEAMPKPPKVECATIFHEPVDPVSRELWWTDVDETAEQIAALVEGR